MEFYHEAIHITFSRSIFMKISFEISGRKKREFDPEIEV